MLVIDGLDVLIERVDYEPLRDAPQAGPFVAAIRLLVRTSGTSACCGTGATPSPSPTWSTRTTSYFHVSRVADAQP